MKVRHIYLIDTYYYGDNNAGRIHFLNLVVHYKVIKLNYRGLD